MNCILVVSQLQQLLLRIQVLQLIKVLIKLLLVVKELVNRWIIQQVEYLSDMKKAIVHNIWVLNQIAQFYVKMVLKCTSFAYSCLSCSVTKYAKTLIINGYKFAAIKNFYTLTVELLAIYNFLVL